MPYSIEVMSLGADLYEVLRIATGRLNSIQNDFVFRLTAEAERAEGVSFQREEYQTDEIWRFLTEHLEKFGGCRPHVIAFVNAPLRSARTSNLFGSHDRRGRLAIATLHHSTQYVSEGARFACYYLVRYALSFVNPTVSSHNDKERNFCYFHRKVYKPEIVFSMNSGRLCDVCAKLIDYPEDLTAARSLNVSERAALKTMRDYIAGLLPHAIVMKGGGIKGLAFVGALSELEAYYNFDRHVGTSAGAITAILLAAGYTPTELGAILRRTDFKTFFDSGWLKAIFWNLPLRRGLFPGSVFQNWLETLLVQKVPRLNEVRMEDLNGAVLYAARSGSGLVVYDSQGKRRESPAAFAARCSMSIPYVFFPQMIDGKRSFDGGLRQNFPLQQFSSDNPTKPVIGLYLGKPSGHPSRLVLPELLSLVLDGEERAVVDAHPESVVVIDTSPVGTLDFNLTDEEKDFLVKIGRAAALAFLQARKFNDGPLAATVNSARQEADAARQIVIRGRRQRRIKMMLCSVAVIVVASIVATWMLW